MTESVLYFLAFFIAFQHLVSPLIVWATTRSPCTYAFPPTDWRQAIQASDPDFRSAHSALEALEFVPIAASGLGDSISTLSFVVYRHPTDLALATLMQGKNWLGRITIVDFTQAYASGLHLSLSNSPNPPVYPSWEMQRSMQLPGMKDVAELFGRFCILRAGFSEASPVLISEGLELESLENFNNLQVKHLCEVGHVSRTCEGGKRRLTIRGAYLSSWKMLQPWKWISLRLNRAEALRQTAL